ncbi:MAG: hypothetical protein EOM41_08185 [Bacilli bacterium]|nr:hypothetical protein [Bacilli bacterium]
MDRFIADHNSEFEITTEQSSDEAGATFEKQQYSTALQQYFENTFIKQKLDNVLRYAETILCEQSLTAAPLFQPLFQECLETFVNLDGNFTVPEKTINTVLKATEDFVRARAISTLDAFKFAEY